MARTTAEIEADIAKVDAAITKVLAGGVGEFRHDGGDGAKMLSLSELRLLRKDYQAELSRAGSGGVFRRICRVCLLLTVVGTAMNNNVIVAGAGIEPFVQGPQPAASEQAAAPTYPHYRGATVDRFTRDYMPPHRSGNSAVRESWDMLQRRLRHMFSNNSQIRRMVSLLTNMVFGDGINCYSAAMTPDLDFRDPKNLPNDPLFRHGDESDDHYERWAEKFASSTGDDSFYKLQEISGLELFNTGNTLWLECSAKRPNSVSPICYQVLETEQLDFTKDRAAAKGQLRIENGIEYNAAGRPVAYWLYDAHPYDMSSRGFGFTSKSRRIPASRVTHVALTSRASQTFGVGIANPSLLTANDTDWLVGHELTSAAIAAGMTLLLVDEEGRGMGLDFGAGEGTKHKHATGYDVPHACEVGLGSGTIATLDKGQQLQVVETANRPNTDIAHFFKFLSNMMSMSGNLSLHRYLGNPEGLSFAALRGMINDDRAMTSPITGELGRRIIRRVRERHDQVSAAMGHYRTISASQYRRSQVLIENYDILGPPMRLLTPSEDIQAAREAIRSGMSNLRRECGLRGLSWRKVLRQMAVEKAYSEALGLTIDFSAGGGAAPSQTTTSATEAAA